MRLLEETSDRVRLYLGDDAMTNCIYGVLALYDLGMTEAAYNLAYMAAERQSNNGYLLSGTNKNKSPSIKVEIFNPETEEWVDALSRNAAFIHYISNHISVKISIDWKGTIEELPAVVSKDQIPESPLQFSPDPSSIIWTTTMIST